ncbi:MFS transporter [Winogradskya humida]|uniref:MFS transporter n=1 Tax=Winogradskya humida TaxID=113566 RepID=A0ABQ3ZL29_9ACTN|nr:MFS transporter [Actinoplanes humidus]GIE19199.1 MFS transporter [Actinoplanes humidus]
MNALALVLLAAGFTLAVDFSILTVALPVIGTDLGFSLSGLQWIATAFALSAAGFTLPFGRAADLFGRRRMFLAGIALLGVSSLVGGLATTPAVLLAARVAQGLATAAITPASLSLLTTSFPQGPRRDRVLGLNGALMAAGFTTGAILGGVLTGVLSWRWAFFVNVVVAVAVLAVGPFVLPSDVRAARRPALDLPGAVLVRVLRRRTVAVGNLAGFLAFATETSLVFLLTLYLQEVLGYPPLTAGLAFAVLGLGTILGGVLGPKVIARLGNAPRAILLGLLVQAFATISLVLLGQSRAWLPYLLVATFVGGVANLVAIVGFTVTATSGLPDGEQGLAAGLATLSQQLGITLGIPAMSAIVTVVLPDVLTAIRTATAVNAALCLLPLLLVARLSNQTRQAEQHSENYG